MRPMPSSAGVDRQRVGQRADADALPGEVMDEVEDFAQVAAEPVEGVGDDGVAVAGHRRAEALRPGPVDDGAGLLFAVDPRVRDAGGGQCVEWPVEAYRVVLTRALAEVESAGVVDDLGSFDKVTAGLHGGVSGLF